VTTHLTDEQIRAGWACPVCGKTGFSTARGASKHLTACTAEPVPCPACGTLVNPVGLGSHRRNAHGIAGTSRQLTPEQIAEREAAKQQRAAKAEQARAEREAEKERKRQEREQARADAIAQRVRERLERREARQREARERAAAKAAARERRRAEKDAIEQLLDLLGQGVRDRLSGFVVDVHTRTDTVVVIGATFGPNLARRSNAGHLAATAAEPVIVFDLAALDNYRSRINHEREQVA